MTTTCRSSLVPAPASTKPLEVGYIFKPPVLGHFGAAFMTKICNKIRSTHFGYHAIRHFTASQLYAKGVSASVIQAILCHTNSNTSARYLRTLGLDPAIREALEEAVSRPAEIISLEERRLVNGRQE
ncbi:MAG: site-specific integrase [Desulfatitalea sp.]|nr:site-specific integrase [Desulfatitalea sp.]